MEEIKIKATSNQTAEMTPIILSESIRTQTLFEPTQVDNSKEPNKRINGKLIFKKITKEVGSFDVSKLSKKDIQSNQYIELQFDCEETYNLAKGLYDYFKLTTGKSTPFGTETYIKQTAKYQYLSKIIDKNLGLIKLLSENDLNLLNIATNTENLNRVKKIIEDNLNENQNEQFWQNLFEENPWVLSQLFSTPYMIFQSQAYVGGKGLENSYGKFPDYIYKNNITNNIAIIEIKKPQTELISKKEYRSGVYSCHEDLNGAINQILNQRDTSYKEYITNSFNSDIDYQALNFNCIVIVGNISKLDNKKLKSFELYRNELKNIQIVGFDELLEKINIMLKLLEIDSK